MTATLGHTLVAKAFLCLVPEEAEFPGLALAWEQ